MIVKLSRAICRWCVRTIRNHEYEPAKLWDMRKPQPITQLNKNGHVSLCGLLSTKVKKLPYLNNNTLLVRLTAKNKLDCHFYGKFGFLAVKEDDIKCLLHIIQIQLLEIRKHCHGTALMIIFIHPFTAVMRHSFVTSTSGCINPEILPVPWTDTRGWSSWYGLSGWCSVLPISVWEGWCCHILTNTLSGMNERAGEWW